MKQEFEKILTLSPAEKRIIQTREPYSYDDYIEFALVASGVNDRKINSYKKIVDRLVGQISKSIELEKPGKDKAERAEFILEWLHKNFFRRYLESKTQIDDMLKDRMFNCVSSSVFYAAICRKFGINITGVIVRDHAFSQLKMPHQKIDIETTVRYGFDPLTKKEILDQFGHLTGFAYVPQKNYRQRTEIGDREMIALIYSNRYKSLSDRKRYAEATKALYVGWKIAGDLPHNLNSWKSGLENYIISLSRSKRFDYGFYVVNRSIAKFPKHQKLLELRRNIYVNWSYEIARSGDCKRGVELIEEGLKFYPRDRNLRQNLTATYFDWASGEFRKNNFDGAVKILRQGMMRGKFDRRKYLQQLEAYHNNRAIELINKGKISEGIKLLEAGIKIVPNSRLMRQNLKLAR